MIFVCGIVKAVSVAVCCRCSLWYKYHWRTGASYTVAPLMAKKVNWRSYTSHVYCIHGSEYRYKRQLLKGTRYYFISYTLFMLSLQFV